MLVGNKSDMVKDLGEAAAAGRALAESAKLPYFTSSAKTTEGVSEIFAHLVSKLPVEERSGGAAPGGAKPATVNVAPAQPRQQGSDCSC